MITSTESEFEYPLYESDTEVFQTAENSTKNTTESTQNENETKKSQSYKMEIVWKNALVMFTVHALAFYGLTLLPRLKVVTLVFMWSLGLLSTLGVQAGNRF